MRKSLAGGLASLAFIIALAVGCGGSDDTPTKAEFIAQADAICKKAHTALDQAFSKAFAGNQQPNQAQLNKFAVEELVPTVQGEIDDVSKIDPPSGDADQVNAIIGAAQSGVDKIKADPAVLSPQVKFDPLGRNHRLARAYGMKECSK
jgi:hypothetical protein